MGGASRERPFCGRRWRQDGSAGRAGKCSSITRRPDDEDGKMDRSSLIEVQKEPPIAVATINHPPANALNHRVLTDLNDALKPLDDDPAFHAVVLTGAGRMFVAGADISAFQGTGALGADELARLGNDLF